MFLMLLYVQLEGGACLLPFIDIAILIKIEWWGVQLSAGSRGQYFNHLLSFSS